MGQKQAQILINGMAHTAQFTGRPQQPYEHRPKECETCKKKVPAKPEAPKANAPSSSD